MQSSPVPEESIRRLLDAQVAAWNEGDAEGWCKDFTEDSEFVNILGMRFRGKDANTTRHAELFAGIFKGSDLRMNDLSVHMLGRATAIADAVLELTRFRGLPPGIRATRDGLLQTRMHYVLAQDDGGRWCVVFSQNTAVMPLPLFG